MEVEHREKEPSDDSSLKVAEILAGDGKGDGDIIDEVPLYRKKRVVIPLFLLIVVAAAVAWYWYINLRDFVSTDDAYIDANRVSVSSKMLGRVTHLGVDEGDTVKAARLLVRLDDSDLRAQETQAKAGLTYAQENVLLAKVNLERAQDDFLRADVQFKGGIIPKEQYDHAQKALDAARAEYAIALSRVGTAKAQLGVVGAELKNTIISAPIDGVVAKRWILEGDVVQPGQPIFTVYDLKNVWVTANLEETKLGNVHIDDPVEISVDTYSGKTYLGKVVQIGTYAASEFSLIPSNNASGNFTKVTQRVPVKISIADSLTNREKPAPLLPGMSVEVTIKVK